MRRSLFRAGLRRGLLGGSRPWTVVFMLGLALRALRRLTGARPRTVYCEELKPGETLVVSHGIMEG